MQGMPLMPRMSGMSGMLCLVCLSFFQRPLSSLPSILLLSAHWLRAARCTFDTWLGLFFIPALRNAGEDIMKEKK